MFRSVNRDAQSQETTDASASRVVGRWNILQTHMWLHMPQKQAAALWMSRQRGAGHCSGRQCLCKQMVQQVTAAAHVALTHQASGRH